MVFIFFAKIERKVVVKMRNVDAKGVLMQKKLLILLVIGVLLISVLFIMRSCNRDTRDDITENKSEASLNEEVSESLNSSNYNDDRWLKIKVKVEDKYVYESDFLKPQEVLSMDIIKENNLDIKGKNAVAEIHSYTADKQFITMSEIVIQDSIQQ